MKNEPPHDPFWPAASWHYSHFVSLYENAGILWHQRLEIDRLGAVLPIDDLTECASEWMRRGGRPLVVGVTSDRTDERVLRTLYQQPQRHVLVTGSKDVGKTAVIQSLALKAARSEVPFLQHQRFMWIDCQNVGPEDSRACLESIFAAVAGQADIVLCLDGLGALLRRAHESDNMLVLSF